MTGSRPTSATRCILARLLRLGEVTEVAVPSVDQEAARDLVRAREDCRGDLMRARHRLSKLLLRQGIVYDGGQAWTGTHDAWLRRQRLANTITQLTFESDYDAMITVKARRDRLDKAIAELAGDSEFTPVVRRLACLRGVSTLTRVRSGRRDRRLVAVHRQQHRLVRRARPLRALLWRVAGAGLDHKTGNTHVRRLLVEAAWHHRPAYRPGKTMHERWELAPAAAATRSDAGNRRLHQRWITFNLRKKRAVITKRRHRPRTRRLVLVAGHDRRPAHRGGLTPLELLRRSFLGGGSARSDPRHSYEQPSPPGPGDARP